MATKLGRIVNYLKELLSKVTWTFDHVVFQNLVTNWNHYIFVTTVPVATKLGRVVTLLEALVLKKSDVFWIMWSSVITWQIKNISLLPQCLWRPKLARWWLIMRGFHPRCLMTVWSCALAKSLDKLKTYFHYYSAYGNQSLQDDDIP